MARNTSFAPGEFYHLYNRGTEKRNIFLTNGDYDRFLALLYLANSTTPIHLQLQGPTLKELAGVQRTESLVDLCAYVLMPNHFHLIVREKSDTGISRFMQKLSTAYTMYFNKKSERSGGLFQGKFRAKHADRDEYLKYLISYVHLNPVKLIEPAWKESGIRNRSKAESYVRQYAYSSYLDYAGARRLENMLIDTTALPDYFESVTDFQKTVSDWLSYDPT